MSYLITSTRGPTAFAGSARTATKAVERIRSYRAVGADHVTIVDERDCRLDEQTLETLAVQEERSFDPA